MNYGNKTNNRRVYQPKTSITNQIITDEEKLAAETALRSLKQKMANKEKKPIRQTNTANQGRRMQNYNNANNKGNNYIHMSHTPNYNNNNMKYNYPSNATEINKNKMYYQNQNNMKQNMNNKKPITANEYRNNHNYNYNMNNDNDLNNNDIYINQNNYPKRNYNQNQYNINNRNNNYKNTNNGNNYYKNYSNNMNNNYSNNNSNYSNNYQLGKPQRFNNASALPNKNNLNLNNYNNYNYNQKISSQEKEDDDLRPIGGGLTADQVPNVSLPTTPCPHCGRSFNSNAFSKHIKICEKVFLQKRKAYNAQKYRFNDSEQASLMKQGAMKEKMNPLLNKKNEGAIPKWKLQSMAFRAICNPGKNRPVNQNMVNNNKLGTNNNKGGNKINNNKIDNTGYDNIPQTMNYAMAYGYKHCEFCNRNYNEEAYNKHLNFCKRRYENEKLKSKTKKTNSNNSGIKNQYSKGIYGSVKYNNNAKYNKKK